MLTVLLSHVAVQLVSGWPDANHKLARPGGDETMRNRLPGEPGGWGFGRGRGAAGGGMEITVALPLHTT
jgi:hypothetical protein